MMGSSNKARLLISIPSTSHIEIAQDELDGLKDLGYDCDCFSYAGKEGVNSRIGRLWVIFRHIISLVKKAYQFKPDIIYFNSRLEIIASSRDFLTILFFRLLYWHKVLFIIKSHGSDLEVLEDRDFLMRKIVLPFLKKQVNAWLFLSSEEKSNVIRTNFLPTERIFVTKNIVRSGQFKKDSNFYANMGIPADHIILLFTGRLIREKGIYEVVEAFERLAATYKVILIIIGDGPVNHDLKEIVKLKGIKNKVIFTGFIPEREVIPYYANSDILVFPTYFPEGFPMALFNAVAAGLAIVTTKTRAAIDYLTAPNNCLWVKPKDSRGVEHALVTLIESQELRQQMYTENLQKGKLFSKEKISAEIAVVISTILTNNKV